MKIKNLNIKNKAAVLTAGGIILGQGAFSAAFFANDRYPFVKKWLYCPFSSSSRNY